LVNVAAYVIPMCVTHAHSLSLSLSGVMQHKSRRVGSPTGQQLGLVSICWNEPQKVKIMTLHWVVTQD